MYRRMMFVGLGGSGGKTLRVLKRDLQRWLDDQGWDGPFPSGWQFIHIDTPTIPDGQRPGGGDLDHTEYLGLIGPGVTFNAVAGKIDAIPGITPELLGWRVDPTALGVPLNMGAGQFRAIGRAVAMAYAQPIKDRLQHVIGKLKNPSSAAELGSIFTLATGEQPDPAPVEPITIVVSSLAGGTGAGLLVDVCDILRALEPTWGGKSFAILYTPEVFLSLGDGATGGVQPNSLAAISEVLNGYWWHGGNQESQVPRKELASLRAAGIAVEIERSGPEFPFLVGRQSSGGVQFSTDWQLFETVGAALVSWATDRSVQNEVVAYMIANWAARAQDNLPNVDVLVNHGNPVERGLPAFSALGFSRMSLGTRYLERYSACRLARDAVEHLANAHIAGPDALEIQRQRRLVDPNQIVDEIAVRYLPWFMHAAQLEERGPDKNQIQDDIRPATWWDSFRVEVARVMQLASMPGSHNAAKWTEQLVPAIEQSTRSFTSSMSDEIQSNIASWTKRRPKEVVRVVEDSMARFGLKVTAALLRMTVDELSHPTDGVAAELLGESERGKYLFYASPSEWQGQLRARVADLRNSKVNQDNAKLLEGVEEAMKWSTCLAHAVVCERTASLVNDFCAGFLKPLSRAIADAAAVLEDSRSSIDDWPHWMDGMPPQELCPPKSEWTVIEPEDFSNIFVSKLAETYSGDSDLLATGDHRLMARAEVVGGRFLRRQEDAASAAFREVAHLVPINVTRSWVPEFSVSQSAEPRQEASFSVNVAPDLVEERSLAWLKQVGTPFEILLSADLRRYTADEPMKPSTGSEAEFVVRRRKVLEKMGAAISSAEPLVGLDPTLIGQIHPRITKGGSPNILRNTGEIPFRQHPLEEEVRQLLIRTCYAGNREALVDEVLVSRQRMPYVDVISHLDSPVSPVVVKSLMEPISNAWTAAKDHGVAKGAFWSKRRARSLPEFIPVPQEHLHAMVRGWFTAKLLGLVKVTSDGQKSRRIEVVRDVYDRVPRWVAFPDVTLSESAESRDQLVLALESLPLAYAVVGTVSSLSPLAPYQALRDLGTAGEPSELAVLYSYEECNRVLRDWVLTGTAGNVKQLSGVEAINEIASAGDSFEGRRDGIVSFLEAQIKKYMDDYEEYVHKVGNDPSRMVGKPLWPALKDEIVLALNQIKSSVSDLESSGGGF